MIKSKSIPQSWCFTDLKNVGEIVTGNTPSMKFPHYYGGNIPWVKPPDINKNSIIYSTPETLSDDGVTKARLLPKGAVLVTCIGNIGNVALAGVPLTTNQQINSIVFNSKITYYKYGFYWCKTLKGWLIENSTSTTISMINKSRFGNAPFLVAPLKEQKRIADKLDNIFLCLDKISRRVNNIKALKQKAIDSSLFDLIENVPYKKESLSRFLQERTERIGTEWGDKRKLGVSARDGIIDLDTGMKTTFENYKIVMPGDFVYNAMRVNIGSIAQYNGSDIAITSPDYIVFKIVSHLSPKLLLGFLKSASGITEINNNTKGSVRSRLYFKSLSNINMPVAPLKIQQKAELLLKWFDDSIAALTTVTDKLEKVKQESLNKAFRGELEPQDPTDEPASKLLERISKDQTSIKEKSQDNLHVIQSDKKRVQNKHISMAEISLLTIIENTFRDQDFSFEELNDSLQQLSKSDYVQLKKQFFELLRNDKYKRKADRITTTIDTPSGTMRYKLQKHETIKAQVH